MVFLQGAYSEARVQRERDMDLCDRDREGRNVEYNRVVTAVTGIRVGNTRRFTRRVCLEVFENRVGEDVRRLPGASKLNGKCVITASLTISITESFAFSVFQIFQSLVFVVFSDGGCSDLYDIFMISQLYHTRPSA